MNDERTILDRVSNFIACLDAKLGVEKAVLFGSTAKGNRLQESDVDLIVVSKSFSNMPIPKRLGLLQNEWAYSEELQALAYTPEEFQEVSQRETMSEILSYATELTLTDMGAKCPKCGRKGSLQTKKVKNRSGKTYTYYYYAHYNPQKKIKWCYVGKERP